ncbi:MAG: TonB-dependent receptor [Pseudomonadota bacterium]|nr:TonB-dependent receptor [Pseudomonadota bacterium]
MVNSTTKMVLLGSAAWLTLTPAFAQDDESFMLDTVFLYGDRTQPPAPTPAPAPAPVQAAVPAAPQTPNAASDVVADAPPAAVRSPDAVSVVSSSVLDAANATTIEQAYALVANVQSSDLTENGFTIRGVNSEGFTPGGIGAPLASVYIDGVQQTVEGSRRGQRDLFDVEQVEVYKGPQSTLQGRAALAGAVYVRTKDPKFEEDGHAQFIYGTGNRITTAFAYGNHFGDTLAYRFSGQYTRKNNDLNYPDYQQYDRFSQISEEEQYTLRGKVLWRPQGNDVTRVQFNFAHSKEDPAPDMIYGSTWSMGAAGAGGYGALRGDGWGTSLAPDFYQPFLNNPLLQFVNPGAPLLTDLAAFEDVRDTTTNNAGLEVTHQINDRLLLTAQTGFTRSVTERHSVNEGTPGAVYVTDGQFTQTLLTQEVRLNYESERMDWVLGVYGGREWQSAFRDQTLPNSGTFVVETTSTTNEATITNAALFGEISYAFASGLSLVAGGRLDYISTTSNATVDVTSVYLPIPGTSTASSNTFQDLVFIPKVGLEYEASPTQKLALNYTQGYRPGGAGIQASTASAYTYDPETAHAIEASYRGSFMDGRATLGASAFYTRFSDQQVEVWTTPGDSTSSMIVNAGNSTSYGVELDAQVQATDKLAFFGSAGFIKTNFNNFTVSSGGALVNFAGQEFPGAPAFTGSIGAHWGEDTGFFANGVLNFVGAQNGRIEGGAMTRLASYYTVDASLGYTWDNGASVTAYATNLTDNRYFTYESAGSSVGSLGDRREIGLKLDYRF